MTEPDEALKFAEAMMRSYDHPSDVVIPPTAPLRIDGRRLTGIEAHNVTQAFARAYRAGQAASAAKIDAARLEGIRLGLEAAAQRAGLEWSDPEAERATNIVASTIRALDPATIAKEADQ